ncbi:MAG: SAM-dependent methyltransferase [Gammaproteobacteria bacterium]|nr:MAG: SAM-dependent methyltransferase [Gammaproteobacteria bacterium]
MQQRPELTRDAGRAWLRSRQGRRLLAAERRELRDALDSIFGELLLQIGDWGGADFFRLARTRRAALLAEWPGPEVAAVSRLDELAVASDSVDAVLLVHALDAAEDPRALLREASRVLRPDGHLVILGFNPFGPWGLRHFLSRRRYPPGARHFISERRLGDWLSLLNFGVQRRDYYHYHLPLQVSAGRVAEEPAERRMNRLARRLRRAGRRHLRRPLFAACYLLVARKEIYPLTLARPGWRRRPRLVGGLVNPTSRNAA